MGDPKKIRPKYAGPMHPWQRDRIEEERVILREFGLKNKKEIWKSASKLKSFKVQAKNVVTKEPTQRSLEEKQLIEKLIRLGLIGKDAKRETVLELTNQDLLGRRLQTLVFKKGLARSIKQARQLIAHGHIFVRGRRVDVPSYLVLLEEENAIVYSPNSDFNDDMHPEKQRIVAKDQPKPKAQKEKLTEADEVEAVAEEVKVALEKAAEEKPLEVNTK